MTITNDGATILKQLDVEHPAAKVLVELADLQDQEVNTYKRGLLTTYSIKWLTHTCVGDESN